MGEDPRRPRALVTYTAGGDPVEEELYALAKEGIPASSKDRRTSLEASNP